MHQTMTNGERKKPLGWTTLLFAITIHIRYDAKT